MALLSSLRLFLLFRTIALVSAQGQCYWAAGAQYLLPPEANVVPCSNDGPSACCKLGDTCLAGNACFNYDTHDTYQYGCTDITYQDASCPFKCGWNPDKSPWVALEYCNEFNGITDTWNCQSPESCGCEWRSTYELLALPVRGCQAMGSLARVAIYGPESLPAYVQLPKSSGGSTGYFSAGASASTPVSGYTPSSVVPFTSESLARKVVQYDATATPAASQGSAVLPNGSLPPIPSTPTNVAPSSNVLGGSGTSTSGGSSSTQGSSSGSSKSSPSGAGAGPTSTGAGSGGSGGSGGNTNNGNNNNNGGGGSGGSGSSLSTGAKVGLGVGIAGGVCLIAAIVLVAMIMRKRKQRANAETYNNEKHNSYNSGSAAYYDPYNRAADVHEAPYTAHEDATARKRMSPQGLPELDSGQHIPELESSSNTPAHTPLMGSHSPRFN